MRLFFILLFLQIVTSSQSQFQECFSSRASAMGLTAVALKNEVSSFQNPVSVVHKKAVQVMTTYSTFWQLTELATRHIGVSLSGSLGTFGSGISQYGYSGFTQERYVLMYGRTYRKITAAFQYNYLNNRFGGGNSYGALFSQISVQANVSNTIVVGFLLQNAERSVIEYANYSVPIPTRLSMGSGWNVTESLLLVSEFTYSTLRPSFFNIGVEQTIIKNLMVRGGFLSKPVQHTLGIGVDYNRISCDVAYLFNHTIGSSSSCSLSYLF